MASGEFSLIIEVHFTRNWSYSWEPAAELVQAHRYYVWTKLSAYRIKWRSDVKTCYWHIFVPLCIDVIDIAAQYYGLYEHDEWKWLWIVGFSTKVNKKIATRNTLGHAGTRSVLYWRLLTNGTYRFRCSRKHLVKLRFLPRDCFWSGYKGSEFAICVLKIKSAAITYQIAIHKIVWSLE